MNRIFDFKKYSLVEYNAALYELYKYHAVLNNSVQAQEEMEPEVYFKMPVLSYSYNHGTLLLTFNENCWIKIQNQSWFFCIYDHDTNDMKQERYYFQKDRTSETISLGNFSYIYRPSKGITYKNMFICGNDIDRTENKKAIVSIPRKYSFRVSTYKKYKEYNLSTDNGLTYFEKIGSTKTLKTEVSVQDKTNSYHITLRRSNDGLAVLLMMSKNYSNTTVYVTDFADCDIDNIYNKYKMFIFDMSLSERDFEIIQKVRELLKSKLQESYDDLKNNNKKAIILHKAIKAIEVMEDDEYQIQKQ